MKGELVAKWLTKDVLHFHFAAMLSLCDVLAFASVCRSWRSCMRSEHVWKQLYKRDVLAPCLTEMHASLIHHQFSLQFRDFVCSEFAARLDNIVNTVVPALRSRFFLPHDYRLLQELPVACASAYAKRSGCINYERACLWSYEHVAAHLETFTEAKAVQGPAFDSSQQLREENETTIDRPESVCVDALPCTAWCVPWPSPSSPPPRFCLPRFRFCGRSKCTDCSCRCLCGRGCMTSSPVRFNDDNKDDGACSPGSFCALYGSMDATHRECNLANQSAPNDASSALGSTFVAAVTVDVTALAVDKKDANVMQDKCVSGNVTRECIVLGPIAPSKTRYIFQMRHRIGKRTLTVPVAKFAAFLAWSMGAACAFVFCCTPVFMSCALFVLAGSLNFEEGRTVVAWNFGSGHALALFFAPFVLLSFVVLIWCVVGPLWWACYRHVADDRMALTTRSMMYRFMYGWLGYPGDASMTVGLPFFVLYFLVLVPAAVILEYFWPALVNVFGADSSSTIPMSISTSMSMPYALHVVLMVVISFVVIVLSIGALAQSVRFVCFLEFNNELFNAFMLLVATCAMLLPYAYLCGAQLLWTVQFTPLLVLHVLLCLFVLAHDTRSDSQFGKWMRQMFLSKTHVLIALCASTIFWAMLVLHLDFNSCDWFFVLAPLVVFLLAFVPFGVGLAQRQISICLPLARVTGLDTAWCTDNVHPVSCQRLHAWRSFLLQVRECECSFQHVPSVSPF